MSHAAILLSLLKNRKHSIGCEVGVHTGDTTKFILENLPKIKKYYAIDPWILYEMYDGRIYRKPGHQKYKTMVLAFKNYQRNIRPYKNKVITYKLSSVEASINIAPNCLDWIFIDANHEYEYIKENLRIWSKKVKPGGLISGHDYGGKWGGIKKAVDEFVPKNKLHIEKYTVWWYIK